MLNPSTTLAIVLGVSECPRAPKLQPLPQCANSAKDFEDYLRSSLHLSRGNIINLFNAKTSPSDQLDEIEDWLVRNMTSIPDARPTDLLVYYTGHGGFTRNDQSYFLAVHKTREGSEGATSIRYSDLASIIKRNAEAVRKYLILDCCFAAAAVLKTQTNIHEVVIQRVEDELPASGTAVLCSSAAKLVSISPPGERHTMFSGALLKCLREGVPQGPQIMTLEDLGKAARQIIQDKYPNDAVRPELHVPEQARGNPAQVPLFPNALWVGDSTDQQSSKISNVFSQGPEASLTTALRSHSVRLVIGSLSGLLSAFSCAFAPVPFGLVEDIGPNIPSQMAPIGPAVFLAGSVLLVLSAVSRLRWSSILLIPFATYFSWSLAWLFLYHSAIRLYSNLYPLYSGIAGYIGSFLLSLALILILRGTRSLNRGILRSTSRKSLALALWAAIAGIPVLMSDLAALSMTNMLGLFVPWQAWYASTLLLDIPPNSDPERQKSQFFWWLAISALFTLSLAPSPIRLSLNQLTLKPGISLTINSATSELVAPKQSRIIVTYDIKSIKITQSLDCNIELRAGSTIYERDAGRVDKNIKDATAEFTVSEKVVTADSGNVSIRASCTIFMGGHYISTWEYAKLSVVN